MDKVGIAEWVRWGLEGIITLLCIVVGSLLLQLKRAQDEKISAIETRTAAERAEVQKAMLEVVNRLSMDNKETRDEFRESLADFGTKLESLGDVLQHVQVTLADKYATFEDLKEYKKELRGILDDHKRDCRWSRRSTDIDPAQDGG